MSTCGGSLKSLNFTINVASSENRVARVFAYILATVYLLLFYLIVFTQLYALDNFQIAETLFSQKNYSEAIKKYQAVIKQSTNYEPAWFGLQTTYLKIGDLASADKLEKIYLSDRLIWGHCRTLFYLNQFDSTLKYIFELSQKFPKSPLIIDAISLGILIVDVGQDTYNLAKYAQAQYSYEKSDYNKAIEVIRELIVKSNKLAEYSYLLLSKTFIAKGEINQAIATLNEFSQKFTLSKLYPKTRYDLGLIYLESIKDTIKAKDIFEDLISDYPDAPESYFARARLAILGELKLKEVPK